VISARRFEGPEEASGLHSIFERGELVSMSPLTSRPLAPIAPFRLARLSRLPMLRASLLLVTLGAALLPPGVAAQAAQAAPAAPAAPGPLLAPLSAGSAPEMPPTDGRVPRPAAFLGYPLGERFTHWDRAVAYLDAVAAASDRVRTWTYGTTYEGRPLKLLAFGSPENLARLDQIRQDRLKLADPARLAPEERERLLGSLPAVVWLAYGVHGNESSSTEAALAVAYLLAAGQGEIPSLLRDMIVLIDPLSNPDGRERYVTSYEQRRGAQVNPRQAGAEHWEPWPGGRQNHYLLDLNRDWAWASQQETRARVAAYRQWEPQVYVDFHEMNSDASYFFPPPAEPVHPKIDRRVVSWLDVFGRANAAAFDRLGWIYFKAENYDLFYPGYGDSYPSLRGAVGMTYEMAGGGRAGLALVLPDGTQLTLADRVARHLATSLSTLRTAAANGRKLLADFAEARTPAAPGRTYLWSGDRQESRALADLLTLHGIQVRQLAEGAAVRARRLERGAAVDEEWRFAAGTYAVSTAQPLGNLVQALLDVEASMAESFLERQRQRFEQNLGSEFYDITAWSLPLAFNLEAWVAPGEVAATRPLPAAESGLRGAGPLGFLVRPRGLATYRLAAQLQERGLRHRVARTSFLAGGASFPSGTLFVPRLGNPADLDAQLGELLAEGGLGAEGVATSYDFEGLSLGSREMMAVRRVRTGLVGGPGVDPTSFGFLWFLLDRQIGVPHDRIDLAQLGRVDLGEIDVLLLPEGDYEDQISDKVRQQLDSWVQTGGVLVAVGGAASWLQKHEWTTVKAWEAPKEEEGDPESPDGLGEPGAAGAQEQLERPIFTPGAALATRMQPNHPLTLGLEAAPPVLVEGSLVLRPTGDPRKDVLVAREESPVIAGFAFPEAEERLAGALLVGVEPRGRGSVVLFAQDPAYRLFWRAPTPILLNALLYGPSAGLGGR
jgi:Zinc carboxypeptidase